MRLIKRAEKGLTLAAGGLHNAIQAVNKYKPNPSFTQVVGQAAAKVVAEKQANPWLAANHRFTLSQLCNRSARVNHLG